MQILCFLWFSYKHSSFGTFVESNYPWLMKETVNNLVMFVCGKYLLDKDIIFLFGSIRSLCFHSWNWRSVMSMLLLMLPSILYFLDTDFMLPFGSIRSLQFHSWNCGSVSYMVLLMLLTLLSLLYALLCIFRNKVVLLFIILICWCTSASSKHLNAQSQFRVKSNHSFCRL